MAVVEETSHDDVLCYLSSLKKTLLKNVTFEEISDAVGRGTESVKFSVGDLEDEGLIKREGTRFTVHSPCRCDFGSRCAASSQKPDRDLLGHRQLASRVDSSQPEVVKTLNGFDLATRFRGVMEKASVRHQLLLGPDPFNHKALAGAFARWRAEGIGSETIALMMEIFADDLPRHRRAGRSIWRLFLAARTSLYDKALARAKVITEDDWVGMAAEQTTYDENYWMGVEA